MFDTCHSPRQTPGFVESQLGRTGEDWAVTEFGTLKCRHEALPRSVPDHG